MKKSLLLLLIITLLSSCNKSPHKVPDPQFRVAGGRIVEVIDDSSLIFGKWKLNTVVVIEKNQPASTIVYDYNSENIVYEFTPENKLFITVSVDQDVQYKGHEPGAYSYFLNRMVSIGPFVRDSFILVINDNDDPYAFSFSDNMEKISITFITEGEMLFYSLVKYPIL
jgi:hypothetical protein